MPDRVTPEYCRVSALVFSTSDRSARFPKSSTTTARGLIGAQRIEVVIVT